MKVNFVCAGLLGVLLCGAAASLDAQPATSLAVLTVPPGRLPSGCALNPVEPRVANATQGRVVALSDVLGPLTPTNPWSGSDRRVAAAIRHRIDGAPVEPDAPPLGRRASAAYALKWVEHVVESYLAAYRSAEQSPIEVFALRFDDQTLAHDTPPAGTRLPTRGVRRRVVLGATVVLVSAGAESSCFAAIENHVRSLRP